MIFQPGQVKDSEEQDAPLDLTISRNAVGHEAEAGAGAGIGRERSEVKGVPGPAGALGPERTISVLALGCKANQEETECLISRLGPAGYRIVPFGEPADWIVVNTCTVTSAGDSDSRQILRRAVRAKGAGRVIATGCLAQRAPGSLAEIPGVDWVVGNGEKPFLDRWILEADRDSCGPLSPVGELDSRDPTTATGRSDGPAPGAPASSDAPAPSGPARILVGADPTLTAFAEHGVGRDGRRARATLKIQDGCDQHCTFCVIPKVRGRSRSRSLEDILGQAAILTASGYQEIALTGINTGLWGRDLPGGRRLPDLLDALAVVEGLARIRLNSLEPQHVRPEWLDRMAANPKLCRHYHFPLQSADPAILRRMNRSYSPEQYAALVRGVQERMPDAAVGCDLLVGFPGESEEQFARSLDLASDLSLSYLHVFSYSARPGTGAPRLPGEVSVQVRKDRSARLRALDRDLRRRFAHSQSGTVQAVLPETPAGEGHWEGLTGNYLRVRFPWSGPDSGAGELPRVRLRVDPGESMMAGVPAGAAS